MGRNHKLITPSACSGVVEVLIVFGITGTIGAIAALIVFLFCR